MNRGPRIFLHFHMIKGGGGDGGGRWGAWDEAVWQNLASDAEGFQKTEEACIMEEVEE